MSELFPGGILLDPTEVAAFGASVGYDAVIISETLVRRFGLSPADAALLAAHAKGGAAAFEERKRADLDRAAISAEHRLDH
jgi:hypothetical protein